MGKTPDFKKTNAVFGFTKQNNYLVCHFKYFKAKYDNKAWAFDDLKIPDERIHAGMRMAMDCSTVGLL
ncbi:MAG: hypothetical protein JSS64_06170 [Bacteroidetes bacterium]|nr:hypothetical protein [Bacteroidota bacterium]